MAVDASETGAPAVDRQQASGSVRAAMLMCAIAAAGLWYLQYTPYLNAANDSGRYMVLGESIAKMGALRLVSLPGQPIDLLYPPGFPLLIGLFGLFHVGPIVEVVGLVKFAQLLFLIATLPAFARLMRCARMSAGWTAAALAALVASPAMIAYAGEVMSEMPFLALCTAAVALGERPPPDEAAVPGRLRARMLLAIVFAAAAFMTRTVGITLLVALVVAWFARGARKMAVLAAAVTVLVVGGWSVRNHYARAASPRSPAQPSYVQQFTLRDPMRPDAGRIQLNALGLASRAKSGLPVYVGMIPRAVLNVMGRGSWLTWFYVAAIPLGLLIVAGGIVCLRRGMVLTVLFAALFWLAAAMWPWQSPRFLVPLVPVFLAFASVALAAVLSRVRPAAVRSLLAVGATAVYAVYCFHVQWNATREAHIPTPAGYTLGRDRQEAGFYAACDWLHKETLPGAVVMGRPAYMLHLYSDHPVVQVEPNTNPKVQEQAYVTPNRVMYVLVDAWPWAHTSRYMRPYLTAYASAWKLKWVDPLGSGVCVYERREPYPRPNLFQGTRIMPME